jgi:diacylglycerol kinase family enzyme
VLELSDFTVTTLRGRVRVANDGEVERMRTPLRYRVLPGALTVLVPTTYLTASTEPEVTPAEPVPIRRPA